jgi:hypothetical protein
MKTILAVIAATSASFSLLASDNVQDPNLIPNRPLGKRTPNVVLANPNTGYQEPNLVAGIRPGTKHGPFTATTTISAKDDPNLLAFENCRGMPSKLKGTARCTEHCAKFGDR